MEMNSRLTQSHRFSIADASQIGEARRVATRLALQAGADDALAGRVAIVVSELCTNILRHAGTGELLMQLWQSGSELDMEVVALDRGRGMDNVARCLGDGYSTAGTSGNGLGAVRRLSREFDIYSQPDAGTVVLSRISLLAHRRYITAATPAAGVICLPVSTEILCGDGWALRESDDGLLELVLIDGLGHGAAASEVVGVTLEVFTEHAYPTPSAFLAAAHSRLSSTRGGALAMARIDRRAGRLSFAGVGNIAGSLVENGSGKGLVSHNGTVGAQLRRVQDFEYSWTSPALLIAHSDGIATRWNLERYPGILNCHPGLIAALLYRDYSRGRDDCTVFVLALGRPAEAGTRP